MNIRQTTLYKSPYNAMRNILDGNIKEATKHYTKFYQEAKINPAVSKLTLELAEKEAINDFVENCNNNGVKNFLTDFTKSVINVFKLRFFTPMEIKASRDEFFNVYNNLYPKTKEARELIIQENRVTIDGINY